MKGLVGYFRIGLAHFLKYKFNVLFNFFMGIFPLYIKICIWINIYSSKSQIENYSKSDMISYFLWVFVIELLINTELVGKEIANEIRDGSILNVLVKPVSYLKVKISKTLGYKFGNLSILLAPVCVLVVIENHKVIELNIQNTLKFIMSVILALILNLLINIFLGILTLKYEEISSSFDLLNIIKNIMSGSLIPLSFLNGTIEKIFGFFPFKYTVSTPIEILLNTNNTNIIYSYIMQLLWIIILLGLIKTIWNKNIKRYGAYGI